MKKLLVILFVVIVVTGIVWFVTATRRGEGEHLVVVGSATMAPLLNGIAGRFESLHPGVHIDVQGGGSGRGLEDVRGGLADIGMVSAPAGRPAAGLHWFAVAKDAVGFIVGRDNPAHGLTRQAVIDIYTGRIRRWPALGGPDRPITTVSWEEGRGALNAVLAYTGLPGAALKADLIADHNGRVTAAVADRPGGIGYLYVGAARQAAARGDPVRLLPLDGVQPTPEHIADGSYPLGIVHSLVTRAPPQGLAKALIDFCRSRQAADLIAARHLIPPTGR